MISNTNQIKELLNNENISTNQIQNQQKKCLELQKRQNSIYKNAAEDSYKVSRMLQLSPCHINEI